jgi:hypothetical protein
VNQHATVGIRPVHGLIHTHWKRAVIHISIYYTCACMCLSFIKMVRGTAAMRCLLHACVVLCCLASWASANAQSRPQRASLRNVGIKSVPGDSPSNPRSQVFTITVGTASPDCYPRKVILVNLQFQPTIELTQGEWVNVRDNRQIYRSDAQGRPMRDCACVHG